MVGTRTKRKSRTVLSQGQSRLLKESLKQLFGEGLIYSLPQKTQREKKAEFLREALNSKALENELMS